MLRALFIVLTTVCVGGTWSSSVFARNGSELCPSETQDLSAYVAPTFQDGTLPTITKAWIYWFEPQWHESTGGLVSGLTLGSSGLYDHSFPMEAHENKFNILTYPFIKESVNDEGD